MTQILAKHYETGAAVEVKVEGQRYAAIEAAADVGRLPWIAPGLIDIQVNGFAGTDFNRRASLGSRADESGFDRAQADWERATSGLYAAGCTGFLATLITTGGEGYDELLPRWVACLQNDPRNGLGIHLEGPWLNPDEGFRGAHPAQFMTPPSEEQLAKWIDICGGALRMITLAPEVDIEAAKRVIASARKQRVVCFAGHSGAMGAVLDQAIEAGLQGWTHLGNAAPRTMDKFENVILHVLGEPRLRASIIPDRLHLPSHVFRALFGALGSHAILTTDAMSAAGVESHYGRQFTLGETVVKLSEDGSARLPDSGRLAGSTLTPFEGVRRAIQMSGLPMSYVWNAFSVAPAELLGFRHAFEVGAMADFCLFSGDSCPDELVAVFHRGTQVFGDEL